jgi:hypothetical protein
MSNDKLDRAFDVMAIALGEAGLDSATIVKFIQNARRSFGVAHEDHTKTKTKADLAALAGELKEKADDSSVDGGSKAVKSSKAS